MKSMEFGGKRRKKKESKRKRNQDERRMKKLLEKIKLLGYGVLVAGVISASAIGCGGDEIAGIKKNKPEIEITDGDYENEVEKEVYEKEVEQEVQENQEENREREVIDREDELSEKENQESTQEREIAEESEEENTREDTEIQEENWEESYEEEVCGIETREETHAFIGLIDHDTHTQEITISLCEGEDIPIEIDVNITPALRIDKIGKGNSYQIQYDGEEWELGSVQEEGELSMRVFHPEITIELHQVDVCQMAMDVCGLENGCVEESSGDPERCYRDFCEVPPICNEEGICRFWINDSEYPEVRLEVRTVEPGPEGLRAVFSMCYIEENGSCYQEKQVFTVGIGKGKKIDVDIPEPPGWISRYIQVYNGRRYECLDDGRTNFSFSREFRIIKDNSVVSLERYGGTRYRIELKVDRENQTFYGWRLIREE